MHECQEALRLEREASESMLTTLCDAHFWVSADGTIASQDLHLDGLMGQSMFGTRLEQYLTDTDRHRLRAAITNMAPAGVPMPGVLLPVSLERAAAPPVVADLFLIDR